MDKIFDIDHKIALLLGLHRRCGERSPLNALPDWIVRDIIYILNPGFIFRQIPKEGTRWTFGEDVIEIPYGLFGFSYPPSRMWEEENPIISGELVCIPVSHASYRIGMREATLFGSRLRESTDGRADGVNVLKIGARLVVRLNVIWQKSPVFIEWVPRSTNIVRDLIHLHQIFAAYDMSADDHGFAITVSYRTSDPMEEHSPDTSPIGITIGTVIPEKEFRFGFHCTNERFKWYEHHFAELIPFLHELINNDGVYAALMEASKSENDGEDVSMSSDDV
jgi:hypothetical protein